MSDDSLDRVRAAYDAVADPYRAAIGDELDHKPLDRAMLDAFVALVPGGPIADVGCGPGHVTAHLARAGVPVLGLDLSPEMIRLARTHHPEIPFEVGSMTALTAADGAWGGAVALYSVFHLDAGLRDRAYRELARAVRPGGMLMVAFHVEAADHPAGSRLHLDTWWERAVDLDVYFLDPREEQARLADAGFELRARLDREPVPGEYPSRRTSLVLRRAGAPPAGG
jgi:SAM-dependent methyltransferase